MSVIRLSLTLFLFQWGYHSYIATLPIAMEQWGLGYEAIGLATSAAAVAQFLGAILSGAAIDQFGAYRLLVIVGLSYLAGSLFLAIDLGGQPAFAAILIARILQGASFGSLLPSAVTALSEVVDRNRLGGAIGLVSVAPNVAFALAVPLSIKVLHETSLRGLSLLTASLVTLGIAILVTSNVKAQSGVTARRLYLVPTLRRSWLGPIAITFLTTLPLGVIITLLPVQRFADQDPGSFFAAAGITTLGLRPLGGRLLDRGRVRVVLSTGVLACVLCSLLLISGANLFAAGVMEGLSGALILPAVALVILDRAGSGSRGSGLGINSASGAAALAVASFGSGLLATANSFGLILLISTAGCLPALLLAWRGPSEQGVEPA